MTLTLRGIWLIARRELGAYFNTTWGYGVVAALLLLEGLAFNAYALTDRPRLSTEVLETFFFLASGFTLTAGVLLTLRLFAEERQLGTSLLLEGAPLPTGAVVAGKFLSAFLFVLMMLALSTYMPALILVNGKVSLGHVFAGYLGLAAIGACAVAIGAFTSSLTRSQVVAGILGGVIVVLFLLWWKVARVSDPPLKEIFSYLSLFDRHFRPFMEGRVSSAGLVYYASVAGAFLFATTRTLQWRRWR